MTAPNNDELVLASIHGYLDGFFGKLPPGRTYYGLGLVVASSHGPTPPRLARRKARFVSFDEDKAMGPDDCPACSWLVPWIKKNRPFVALMPWMPDYETSHKIAQEAKATGRPILVLVTEESCFQPWFDLLSEINPMVDGVLKELVEGISPYPVPFLGISVLSQEMADEMGLGEPQEMGLFQ